MKEKKSEETETFGKWWKTIRKNHIDENKEKESIFWEAGALYTVLFLLMHFA